MINKPKRLLFFFLILLLIFFIYVFRNHQNIFSRISRSKDVKNNNSIDQSNDQQTINTKYFTIRTPSNWIVSVGNDTYTFSDKNSQSTYKDKYAGKEYLYPSRSFFIQKVPDYDMGNKTPLEIANWYKETMSCQKAEDRSTTTMTVLYCDPKKSDPIIFFNEKIIFRVGYLGRPDGNNDQELKILSTFQLK